MLTFVKGSTTKSVWYGRIASLAIPGLVILAILAWGDITSADNLTQQQKSRDKAQVLATYHIGDNVRLYHATMTAQRVVFSLYDTSSSRIVCYDTTGVETFRLNDKDKEFNYGRPILSANGNVLIISKTHWPEWRKVEVYDLENNSLLFERGDVDQLYPSPSGEYLINDWNEISEEDPVLFRRDGNIIRRYSTDRANWTARFINDSVLALAIPGSVKFISTHDGRVLRNEHFEGIAVNMLPLSRASTVLSKVVIYSYHIIVVASLENGIEQIKRYSDYIHQVMVNKTSGSLAVLFGKKDHSAAYIRFTSLEDLDSYADASCEKEFIKSGGSIEQPFDFVDGTLGIFYPGIGIGIDVRKGIEYKTYFYQFDETTMTISQRSTHAGVYKLRKSNDGSIVALHHQPGIKSSLIVLPDMAKGTAK